MSGIRLQEMDSAEMLDVLHFLFEEDLHVSTAAEVESISKTRTTIYRDLYNREYKYGVTVENERSGRYASGDYIEDVYPEDGFQGEDLIPFNPEPEDINPAATKKPYIAPTDVNPDSVQPFGRLIDGPING